MLRCAKQLNTTEEYEMTTFIDVGSVFVIIAVAGFLLNKLDWQGFGGPR